VLREEARQRLGEETTRLLFGEDRRPNEKEDIASHAGCVQIIEAKLLAFPVRSLAGCFAWLTCPAVLRRFQRDTGIPNNIPANLEPNTSSPVLVCLLRAVTKSCWRNTP